MAKMNSTTLYVATSQIILKSRTDNPSSWKDLYRLVPYLRNSLCCVVCCNLLINPLTPSNSKCQHHLCKKCQGGKKKIKPACAWCKECEDYSIYSGLLEQSNVGAEHGADNLLIFIKEGATFQDQYESNVGLNKSVYSILPCIYTNSSTQTLQNNPITVTEANQNVILNKKAVNSPLYSVMYAGTGNKITIRRKPKEVDKCAVKKEITNHEKSVFKKPINKCVTKQRRGCRCGNATATPGKLTCCGQRCPCYVESKACLECKCRGCRNPHTSDGNKVLNLQQYQEIETDSILGQQDTGLQHMTSLEPDLSLLQHVKIELDANLTIEQLNEHLKVFESFDPVQNSLPRAYMMNIKRDDDDDEITVDV